MRIKLNGDTGHFALFFSLFNLDFANGFFVSLVTQPLYLKFSFDFIVVRDFYLDERKT